MKSKQNGTPWEDAILIVEKFWNTIALASEPSSINYWCSRWDRDVCGRGCWWREGWVRARGESFFRPNRGVKVSRGDVDVPVSEEGVRFVWKWPHGNGRSPKVARSHSPRTIANASETATMLNVANCALFSHVIKSRIKEAVRLVIVHPSLGVVNAAWTAASIDDRVAGRTVATHRKWVTVTGVVVSIHPDKTFVEKTSREGFHTFEQISQLFMPCRPINSQLTMKVADNVAVPKYKSFEIHTEIS